MLAMLLAIFSFTSQQLLEPGLDGGYYHLFVSFLSNALAAHPAMVKLLSEAVVQYYQSAENKTYSFLESTRLT